MDKKSKNIFTSLKEADAQLLYKIITQMDAQEEGIKIAAMNAAARFFAKNGYKWSDVANAIINESRKDNSDANKANEYSHPSYTNSYYQKKSNGPTNANPKYTYWGDPTRKPKQAEEFKSGKYRIHIIDTMYQNGRLRVILKLGQRVFRVYVTETNTAIILRENKGKTIEAHVRNEGTKWFIDKIYS